MKIQRSLQQAICLGCMLIFLSGCAAYGSRLATQPAELPPGSTQASLPVRDLLTQPADAGALAPTATPTILLTRPFTPTLTPVPCITITYTSTPTQTASVTPTHTYTPTPTQTAYTHIPPGLAKKTRTPTPHIPPGLAKKTGTPTPHIPPGQAKKTPTPTWTGSVLIEGGKWGIPGCPGETINIKVEFAASSPFGEVDSMHVGGWTVGWEPFVPLKFYPHTFGVNWYYWGICAQFRDEYGNLSPVYCDDISMEGMVCFTPPP